MSCWLLYINIICCNRMTSAFHRLDSKPACERVAADVFSGMKKAIPNGNVVYSCTNVCEKDK